MDLRCSNGFVGSLNTALPVVIFSSSARDEDREQAKALGAPEFVSKPRVRKRFETWCVSCVSNGSEVTRLSSPQQLRVVWQPGHCQRPV